MARLLPKGRGRSDGRSEDGPGRGGGRANDPTFSDRDSGSGCRTHVARGGADSEVEGPGAAQVALPGQDGDGPPVEGGHPGPAQGRDAAGAAPPRLTSRFSPSTLGSPPARPPRAGPHPPTPCSPPPPPP